MFYASQSILEMDLFQMLVVSAFQLRLSKSEQISKSISEVEERVTVWRIQRYLIPSNTLPPHARKKKEGNRKLVLNFNIFLFSQRMVL